MESDRRSQVIHALTELAVQLHKYGDMQAEFHTCIQAVVLLHNDGKTIESLVERIQRMETLVVKEG